MTDSPADDGRTPAAVERLLRDAPLIDGHNDLAHQIRVRFGGDPEAFDARDARALEPPLHTDLTRLRRGCVGGQFWAAYVPVETAGAGAARAMFEQIDVVRRFVARYPDLLAPATSADEIESARDRGVIASLVGVEGGHGIEDSAALLRAAFALGARYLTLVHNVHTAWADCAVQEPLHGGLTADGRALVREMNRLGMLVDLSHAAPATMADALRCSRAPVACTHSGARSVTDHPRNVPDEILERIAEADGIVMATFVPQFVCAAVRDHRVARRAESARLRERYPDRPERRRRALREWDGLHPAPRASLADVVGHLEHLRAVAGVEHVGIGSDFDGIEEVPTGLEDVAAYPALFARLARAGWSEPELRALAGGNLLRVLRAVQAAAG